LVQEAVLIVEVEVEGNGKEVLEELGSIISEEKQYKHNEPS
jgi:hypothetical protein